MGENVIIGTISSAPLPLASQNFLATNGMTSVARTRFVLQTLTLFGIYIVSQNYPCRKE
jgi:hypothetical protein